MDNKYVTDRIDEFAKLNKEYTRKFNELLSSIRGEINKKVSTFELAEKESHDQAYNQGVKDLWEAVYAIVADISYGGLSTEECANIFGYKYSSGICRNLTCFEVLDRYKKFKEAKEEKERQEKEANTLKRGNIVRYTMVSGIIRESVYLGEENDAYLVVGPPDICPQRLPKDMFALAKTDGYVDLYTYLRDREG